MQVEEACMQMAINSLDPPSLKSASLKDCHTIAMSEAITHSIRVRHVCAATMCSDFGELLPNPTTASLKLCTRTGAADKKTGSTSTITFANSLNCPPRLRRPDTSLSKGSVCNCILRARIQKSCWGCPCYCPVDTVKPASAVAARYADNTWRSIVKALQLKLSLHG